MSDDFHRPTLTFPNNAYNATQVRLYGIKASGDFILPDTPHTVAGNDTNVSVHVVPDADENLNTLASKELDKLRKEAGAETSDVELFSDLVNGRTKISEPRVPLGFAFQQSVDVKKLGTVVLSVSILLPEAIEKQKAISCGIIVGYAYEGHTYDLPKPKVMILPTLPEPRIPPDDSEFDKKEAEGYAVWIVDKLDDCAEFDVSQGFIEQIVLEANLPGKRAPTMYAGRMMLGHRSGKMME